MAITFYRIVHTAVPTLDDFKSHRELGRPLTSLNRRREWEGVSVLDDVEEARRKSQRYRDTMGRYIAEVEIPDGRPIQWKKSFSRGHYTLWGTPEELLACCTGRIVEA